MVRDMDKIDDLDVLTAFENLTMIEEMLLAPVLPIMSIVTLKGGQTVKRGFAANFRQDSITFLKELPRTAAELPILLVRKPGETEEHHGSKLLKINRSRVELVGRWLVQNNPVFRKLNVTFSADKLAQLPDAQEGNINDLLPACDAVGDIEHAHGAKINEDESDSDEDDCEVFVEHEDLGAPQEQQIRDAVLRTREIQVVNWPKVSGDPIDEWKQDCMATLAFPKLFPLGEADPTNFSRLEQVIEFNLIS